MAINYILQGGGEHARVVVDALLANGDQVVALFDPKYSDHLMGVPQLGTYNPTLHPNAFAIVAIGGNLLRKKVAGLTKHKFGNVISNKAIVSPFSTVGAGAMILQGAIIQAQSKIGDHVIINTGAQVDHDNEIESYVHVGPGAILCGTIKIGEGAFIGAGSVVLPGKKIGAWATVGAGAVVLQDIPPYAVCVGNPARIIRYDKHHA